MRLDNKYKYIYLFLKWVGSIVLLSVSLASSISQPLTGIHNLAHAIAMQEGFFIKHSKAARNHNPGNIKNCKGKYVHYKTDAEGWAALEHQLDKIRTENSSIYDLDMDFINMGKIYANDWKHWGYNVAKYLGVNPKMTLRTYFGFDNYPLTFRY